MTDDREALLAAIRINPDEDAPRLMYADHLDGLDAPTDLDRATAEFVRLSCDMRAPGRRPMPRRAYPWLDRNWHRLVPTVLAGCHLGPDAMPQWRRHGRTVRLWLPVPYPKVRGTGVRRCPVVLDFHRGLLARAVVWSCVAIDHTFGLFLRDQPDALLDSYRTGKDLTFRQLSQQPDALARLRRLYSSLAQVLPDTEAA
jgi:uncharacterized protein (TIGR02996 family)